MTIDRNHLKDFMKCESFIYKKKVLLGLNSGKLAITPPTHPRKNSEGVFLLVMLSPTMIDALIFIEVHCNEKLPCLDFTGHTIVNF